MRDIQDKGKKIIENEFFPDRLIDTKLNVFVDLFFLSLTLATDF